MIVLKVLECSEGYKHQGPKYIRQGPASAQEFREGYLIPWLEENRGVDVGMAIDFRGTEVYSASFLEESFVGAINKGYSQVKAINFLNIPTAEFYFLQKIIDTASAPMEKKQIEQPPVYRTYKG